MSLNVRTVTATRYVTPLREGGERGGAIGRLPPRARFDWLVAPRSTIVRTSAVHAGLCFDPRRALEQLLRKMVSAPPANT
ncbi:MAG TPA: DUF3037 domain-containing protein [Pyrinomonadaceae bacterium]|nr:DUF3037 domain-containing protein [Pyrinomonadaceae bacterium]